MCDRSPLSLQVAPTRDGYIDVQECFDTSQRLIWKFEEADLEYVEVLALGLLVVINGFRLIQGNTGGL